MAGTGYRLILAVLLVTTGSLNTLAIKWADITESESSDGKIRKFYHPFFQVTCMFVGEFFCLVAFKVLYMFFSRRGDRSESVHELTHGNRDFNPCKLIVPTLCDMAATSLMFLGLNLTYASSYQMLRGAVVIFVALLSMVFLGKVMRAREWFGIVFIILGLVIVGLADFMTKKAQYDKDGNLDIVIGDLFIVLAQFLAATQYVIEEKYVVDLDIPPLQVVGWEGILGFVFLSILLIPMYFIPLGPPFTDNPREVLEDALDAFVQMGNSYRIIIATLGFITSIAIFNFSGISITKKLSGITRMMLNCVRMVVIWIVSVVFLGQEFQWIQVIGLIVLVFGMCLYNDIGLDSCKYVCVKTPDEEGDQN